MEQNSLVVLNNNVPTLSEKVEAFLDEAEELKEAANEHYDECRAALLKAMIDNQIYQAKIGKYTISQVVPKNVVTFDVEKFMIEQNQDIVNAFTKNEQTFDFDMETFVKECPEIYNKYLRKQDNYVVDTDRLSKVLPEIYNKYITISGSEKPITIRILKKKV